MREFKFRYWDEQEKKLIHFTFGNLSAGTVYPDYDKVMQYTGMNDKNGVEIYEDDMIKHPIYGVFAIEWDKKRTGWYCRDPELGDIESFDAAGHFGMHICSESVVLGYFYEKEE